MHRFVKFGITLLSEGTPAVLSVKYEPAAQSSISIYR